MPDRPEALDLAATLDTWLSSVAQGQSSSAAIRPGHRVPFHWPLPSVSKDFRVPSSAWSARGVFRARGEEFPLEVADVPQGVFGRVNELWVDARGDTEAEMIEELSARSEPLFRRQETVGSSLGQDSRFTGVIRDLEPLGLLKLLFCPDRDVAHEARIEIETHASNQVFTPSLVRILTERRHAHRRSAQWAVLDLFEDLPSFCPDGTSQSHAVEAMKGLIWDAEDDFARTTFKAGVVLGGHLPADMGGKTLMECLDAPSKFGRRSAIHGLFHVVEWEPSLREPVVLRLSDHAGRETDSLLAVYARSMARDIAAGADHVAEPLFEDEA